MPGIEEKEFIEIFNKLYRPVRSYVYYKTGDMNVADDITQDAFEKIWSGKDSIKKETVGPLLYRITGNLCKNRFNHNKVVLQFAGNYKAQVEVNSPEFELELKEFDLKLQKSISALKEKDRVVFLMNRIDGYTYNEIAEKVGISVKAVEKRMQDALELLRNKIEFRI
jgi:RNA polymerase sigma factor (sigma-70 family)